MFHQPKWDADNHYGVYNYTADDDADNANDTDDTDNDNRR